MLVMLSVMPPWLMPALLAGGGVALVIYLVGVVPELYGKNRHRMLTLIATPEGIKRFFTVINIAKGAVAVALLGGLIYYVFSIYEPTKTVWTHPTMTASYQEKTKAECQMLALEKVGAGDWVTAVSGRAPYMSACLTSKGFVSKEVKR